MSVSWVIESLRGTLPSFARLHAAFENAQSTFVSDSERTFSHPHKSKITVLGFVLSPFSLKIKGEKQIVPNCSTTFPKLECFKFIVERTFNLLLSLSSIWNFLFFLKKLF